MLKSPFFNNSFLDAVRITRFDWIDIQLWCGVLLLSLKPINNKVNGELDERTSETNISLGPKGENRDVMELDRKVSILWNSCLSHKNALAITAHKHISAV